MAEPPTSKQLLHFPSKDGSDANNAEWPMLDYVRSWKMFRGVSNEAHVISRHILTQEWHPEFEKKVTLLDVGPGDGVLLKQMLLRCSMPIKRVIVVEPDLNFLNECRRQLEPFHFEIIFEGKKIEDLDRSLLADVDIAVFSHVVYFTGAAPLHHVLDNLRIGSCCYVIVDQENSIFSKLWKKTAPPQFLERVSHVRRAVENLDSTKWKTYKTTVATKLDDPADLSPDVAVFVKSLLCYADYRDLTQEDTEWVETMIKRASASGAIRCTSDCFEIIRI